MTDEERIAQLERDNSQLKETLRYFLKYIIYEDFPKAAERLRERGATQYREAEMLDAIAPLLKT
jgi:hypothetical protein